MNDRDAWLDWRRHGLGASDAAALVGLSRYASPWSLWANKVGLLPDTAPSRRMRVGQLLEPAIGTLFSEETGLHLGGEQTQCGLDWARCTVDGFVLDGEGSDIADALGVHEIKTTNQFGWPDGPPVDIRCQQVWQMGVTGLRHSWLSVLHGGFDYRVYELDWDDAVERDWALMRDAGERFWTEHVLTGIPPDVDDSEATRQALIAVYPDHEPGEGVSLDHLRDELAEREHLKELMGEAKKRVALIDNAIREAIGDATFGTVDGERVLKCVNVHVRAYEVAERTDHRLVAATKRDRQEAA